MEFYRCQYLKPPRNIFRFLRDIISSGKFRQRRKPKSDNLRRFFIVRRADMTACVREGIPNLTKATRRALFLLKRENMNGKCEQVTKKLTRVWLDAWKCQI